MASNVDEITINYSEDNQLIVKELDKVILSKGAWTTIVFRYQELNRAKASTARKIHHPSLSESRRHLPPQIQIQHFQSGPSPKDR